MGEEELPGPFVRTVEAVGHQRLDVVEGILHLLVEAKPERPYLASSVRGPAFSSGSTIPPLRVLAPQPRSWASSRATDRPRMASSVAAESPA